MAKTTEIGMRLAALNEEARRRGMNYGQFVALTTKEEKEEIIRKFDREKAVQRRGQTPFKQKASGRKK